MSRSLLTALAVVATLNAIALGEPFTTIAEDHCDDGYLLDPNQPSPSPPLTVGQINDILRLHNTARRSVNPAARVMPMLTWNPTLATYSQEYIDTCPGFITSDPNERQNPGRFGVWYVGQNIAAGPNATFGGPTGQIDAVLQFINERENFVYPSCADGEYCERYTQVIWADTTSVGCGFKYCGSTITGPPAAYWACSYAVGGNMAEGEPPKVIRPYELPQAGENPAECSYGYESSTNPVATTAVNPTAPTVTFVPTPTTAPGVTTTAPAGGATTTTPNTTSACNQCLTCNFNICDIFSSAPSTPVTASAVMTVLGLAAAVVQMLA